MQHIYEIEIKGMSNLTNGLQKLTNVILIQLLSRIPQYFSGFSYSVSPLTNILTLFHIKMKQNYNMMCLHNILEEKRLFYETRL